MKLLLAFLILFSASINYAQDNLSFYITVKDSAGSDAGNSKIYLLKSDSTEFGNQTTQADGKATIVIPQFDNESIIVKITYPGHETIYSLPFIPSSKWNYIYLLKPRGIGSYFKTYSKEYMDSTRQIIH